MKEIKETREVVTGYEAVDGQYFADADKCREYEETARITLYNDIKPYIVKKGTWSDINDDMSYDDDLYVINIANADVRDKVNMWLNIQRYKPAEGDNVVKEEHIGKEILIFANYDHDGFWTHGNIDDYHAMLRKKYENWINPPQTEQK